MKKTIIIALFILVGCKDKPKPLPHINPPGHEHAAQVTMNFYKIDTFGGASDTIERLSKTGYSFHIPEWRGVYNLHRGVNYVIYPDSRFFFIDYQADCRDGVSYGQYAFHSINFPGGVQILAEITKERKFKLKSRNSIIITSIYEFKNREDYENFIK